MDCILFWSTFARWHCGNEHWRGVPAQLVHQVRKNKNCKYKWHEIFELMWHETMCADIEWYFWTEVIRACATSVEQSRATSVHKISCHISSQISCHISSQISCHISSQILCHISSQISCHISSQISYHIISQISYHISSKYQLKNPLPPTSAQKSLSTSVQT